MMQIEQDKLLEYLLTGEDAELVEQTWRFQPNARALLGRAKLMLRLVAGRSLGKAVSRRLSGLERKARRSRSDSPALGKSVDTLRGATFGRAPPALATRQQDFLSERAHDEAMNRGLRRAIELGKVTVDRLLPVKLPNAEHERPTAADLPAGGRLTLSLRETREGGHLTVSLATHPPCGAGVALTWSPDRGTPQYAKTDAAGSASLPWSQAVRGRLRIDADRTIEVDIESTL